MKVRALLLLALFLAIVPVGLSISSWRAVPVGMVDGRLPPCSSVKRCACSEGSDATIQPLAFHGDPEAAFLSLVEFLSAQPRVTIVTQGEGYVHAVVTSPALRFRDDVEFRLDAAASRIHVRSSARVGFSDFGANRRRIESLRARWRPPA